MSAQRYTHPTALQRMADQHCPECGLGLDTHSDDTRFWIPRHCDLTRVGVEQRIAQYEADVLAMGGAS